MLKKMPVNAKEYLCRIFNKLWQTSYFPAQWNTAIVVRIHNLARIIAVAVIIDQFHSPAAFANCTRGLWIIWK